MMGQMKHNIEAVCRAFAVDGAFRDGGPYGSGHINDTYAVTIEEQGRPVRYILQRINHNVFRQPEVVMSNIDRVAAGADDIGRRALTLIPTTGGDMFHVDEGGNTWRMYVFIEDALTYDELETTDQAFQAARAFGSFMKQLADLPGEPLVETIAGFHDTRSRFEVLQKAISADVCNRAADVSSEIDFACQRESIVGVLLDLHASGAIPW